jgi:hypothetical protein
MYEHNEELCNLFLRCWKATNVLWGYLTEEQQQFVPKDYADIIARLRDDILGSLNRDRGIQIGFAPSFSELRDVLHQHDEILHVSENAFTPTTRRAPYLASEGGVRRTADQ